jgi:hypothetical protein
MKNLLKKVVLICLVATFTSCSEDGKDGIDGTNGTNGTNGNANVVGTTDFTILPTDWQTTGNLKSVTITNNGVTQNIVNSGIVMVYQKSVSGSSYVALPFSYQGIDRGFAFGLNYIQITLSASSPITVTANTVIRAVIIPSSSRMANVNWNNYAEVKDKFKLKD